MITDISFSIFCIFHKNRSLWLCFHRRNEFCMQKYPNKGIFIGFAENSHFSENFRTGYSMAIFMLTAKKLIYTALAIFGFFPSNKHDSFDFRKFCFKLIENITKKQKIIITNIYFLFSAYFSKTVGFGSVFSAEMNSACKNTIIRVFLQDLQKTAIFLRIFEQAYSMAIFMLTAKKLIYTNLAIFFFFPSNKHDSFDFRKFCLKLIEKITKNRK